MASRHALELRVTSLEARVSDLEVHEDTLYKLHRAITRADLRWVKVMERMALTDVTEAEVDEVLDEE
jgi:hypothetical protein